MDTTEYENLRKKLYEDLLAKANDRRAQSEKQLGSVNQVTPEEVQSLSQQGRDFTLAKSMINAANKIGNYQGTASTSDAGSTLDELQKNSAQELAARQKMYENASSESNEANKDLLSTMSKYDEQASLDAPIDEELRTGINDYLKTSKFNTMQIPAGMTNRQIKASPFLSKVLEVANSAPRAISKQYMNLYDEKDKRVHRWEVDPITGIRTDLGAVDMSPGEKITSTIPAKIEEKNALNTQTMGTEIAKTKAVEGARYEAQEPARKSAEQKEIDKENRSAAKTAQQKISDVEYQASVAKNNVKRLKEILKENGTFNLTGPITSIINSAIYDSAVAYAKLIDPATGAREGEVALAKEYLLPLQKGWGLGLKNSTAMKLLDNFEEMISAREKFYVDIAKKGLDPSKVEPDKMKYKVWNPSVSEETKPNEERPVVKDWRSIK